MIVAANGTTAAWGNPGQLLLASQVAAGAQASFDTNTILGGNLPTGFNHLIVRLYARGDTAGASTSVLLRFNNDSTVTNYVSQQLLGTAATASANEFPVNNSGLRLGVIPAAGATASYTGELNIDVPRYNDTSLFKVGVCRHANAQGNSTGLFNAGVNGGVWINAAAITRVAVVPLAGNFVANSWFAVYGLL